MAQQYGFQDTFVGFLGAYTADVVHADGLHGVEMARALRSHAIDTANADGRLAVATLDLVPTAQADYDAAIQLSRPLRRLLVVDDDRGLAGSIREHLIGYGCEVLLAGSEDDAQRVLDDQQEPLDLAIVDIHLHREANDFSGLDVAAEIQSQWRDVPIVLMTGHEEIFTLTDVPHADNLQVCDLLLKPLGPDELFRALMASGNDPRKLRDILGGNSAPESGGNTASERRDSPDRPTWNQQITELLGEISKEIGAESVVLFSIHPISMEARIVARHDPNHRVPHKKANIERSPILDVAIEGEQIFTADASDRHDFPKHRWLQRAYGYRSCIAVRVSVSSELAYGLFGFHTTPGAFHREHIPRMRQVARQIGAMLYAERTEKRLSDVEPYELLGRSYGSMAHDLRGVVSPLVTSKLLDMLKKEELSPEDLQAAKEKIQTLHENLTQAAAIVRTFTGVARGVQEEEQNVVLLNLLRPHVQSLADQHRIVRSDVIVSEGFDLDCRVCVRPTGLGQVLFNLVLNAVQQIQRFSLRDADDGCVVVELTHETREDVPYACIRIHDTGPGLHAADFDRVFEDGYTTKEGGLGMGLDICRRMVGKKTHVGWNSPVTIRNSILFTGTTFEISIPTHG